MKRPKKKETLAEKQEERIRRLNHFRKKIPEFSAQWWVRVGEIFGLAVLFLVNLFLLYPFFGHEDRVNVFSAPVIPVLATFTERFIAYSSGIRVWLLAFLLFFPLSFYYLVKRITNRKLTAFLASFVVILPIRFFLLLRVNLGLLGGDGVHVASLTFIPLTCLFLLCFLRQGNFWSGIFSALGAALVALTSPLGFLTLTVFMGIITFSEMLLGQGRLKLVRFLTVLILAIGLSSFWYNPKFILLVINSSQGELLRQSLANLFPLSFFIVPLLGTFGFLLFENRPQLQSMFIAFFLTVAFGLFSLGTGVAHLLPSRFLPAFGIGLAFLIGVSTVWLFDFLRNSARRLAAFGLIGVIFALIVLITIFFSGNLWQLEKTQVLGLSAEEKVGIWEIKERTNQFENIFGYGITGLTVLGVLMLKTRLKQNEQET